MCVYQKNLVSRPFISGSYTYSSCEDTQAHTHSHIDTGNINRIMKSYSSSDTISEAKRKTMLSEGEGARALVYVCDWLECGVLFCCCICVL